MDRLPRLLIRRPRQRAFLARPRFDPLARPGTMVVVAGPSGSGKSVLASHLADRLIDSHRVAWCRLAAGWNRATDLPVLACEAVGRTRPEIEDGDLMGSADALVELLDAEPTTLVIEDFHEIDGSDGERLLAEIASYLPDDALVVVTTRRRPAELIGLADPELVTVVTAEDLAFDDVEAHELLDARGIDPVIAEQLVRRTGGLASAVAAIAEGGAAADDSVAGDMVSHAILRCLSDERLSDLGSLIEAASVLPYLTVPMVKALGLGSEADLDRLAEESSFVSTAGGTWRLHDAAASVVAIGVDRHVTNRWRVGAAGVLAEADLGTAIELLIEADAFEAAGDLLASRASEVGADRATEWLYRMPADVRQRMPPVLAGGRATVNMSLAIVSARMAVDAADTDRHESEAFLGLGSLLLAGGDLGEAAAAFESCLRRADNDEIRRQAGEHLGHARWYAGDAVGARSVLQEHPETLWAQWLLGMMALVDGDLDGAQSCASASIKLAVNSGGDTAVGQGLLAAVGWMRGDDDSPRQAAEAYEAALVSGGRALGATGPVHGWIVLSSGDGAGALAIAEQIERGIGRQDFASRLNAALLRRRATQLDPGLGDAGRDQRRVTDLRTKGYAALESLASALDRTATTAPVPVALRVTLLGSFTIAVDGAVLGHGSWKSRKAEEVCAYLTNSGERGATREQAIEAVWPGRDPDKGRTLLRTALSEVRRVLEPRRGAGQTSRFVVAEGDRVAVTGTSDLIEADDASERGEHTVALRLLAAGLAPDLPSSDWVEDLRAVVDRRGTEVAIRVVAADAEPALTTTAYELLIAAEPWNKQHFDALIAHHRGLGDAAAAGDVERRWFADD